MHKLQAMQGAALDKLFLCALPALALPLPLSDCHIKKAEADNLPFSIYYNEI
jgi:hypothetical protein